MSDLNGTRASSWEPERRVTAAKVQLRRIALALDTAMERLDYWKGRVAKRGPSKKRRRMIDKYATLLANLQVAEGRTRRLKKLAEDQYIKAVAGKHRPEER